MTTGLRLTVERRSKVNKTGALVRVRVHVRACVCFGGYWFFAGYWRSLFCRQGLRAHLHAISFMLGIKELAEVDFFDDQRVYMRYREK